MRAQLDSDKDAEETKADGGQCWQCSCCWAVTDRKEAGGKSTSGSRFEIVRMPNLENRVGTADPAGGADAMSTVNMVNIVNMVKTVNSLNPQIRPPFGPMT